MPPLGIRTILKWARRPVSDNLDALSWYYHRAEDLLFIRRYSLEFEGFVPREELATSAADSLAHSYNYRPYSTYHLRLLIREALDTGIEFENFVDVGCGRGQPCIFARRHFHFAHVYGVDFSEPLIEAAGRNAARTPYDNVSFEVADASKWRVPDGNTIFFLFNPFDAVILEAFLRLNLEHFVRYRSLIAYGYDKHRDTMCKLGFEILSRSYRHQQSILRYTGSAPAGQP